MRGRSVRPTVAHPSRRDLTVALASAPLLLAASEAALRVSARDLQWQKITDHARIWRVEGAVKAVERAREAGLNPFWWSGSYISPDRSRLTLLFGDWHIPGSTVYRASADGVVQTVARPAPAAEREDQ